MVKCAVKFSVYVRGWHFKCNISGRQYDININFTCDSAGVVYLLGCKVCSKQHVGNISISFRRRFNNYKSPSRKFPGGVLVKLTEFVRHFTVASHHGLLEDVSSQIIVRASGLSRHKEGFWPIRQQCFMPEALNVRFVDHKLMLLHFPSLIASFVSSASIQFLFIFLHTYHTPCIISYALYHPLCFCLYSVGPLPLIAFAMHYLSLISRFPLRNINCHIIVV